MLTYREVQGAQNIIHMLLRWCDAMVIQHGNAPRNEGSLTIIATYEGAYDCHIAETSENSQSSLR